MSRGRSTDCLWLPGGKRYMHLEKQREFHLSTKRAPHRGHLLWSPRLARACWTGCCSLRGLCQQGQGVVLGSLPSCDQLLCLSLGAQELVRMDR